MHRRPPTKAMEADPTLEYEIYLARKLSRTVDELRRTMSGAEFTRQFVYDMREVQRRELQQAKAKRKGR